MRFPMLCIDTSGSFCSVSLWRACGLETASGVSAGDGDHFEQLPRMVERVSHEGCIAVHDVCEVRVGVGPGSFTGIRIGMSFAKGLAWALQVPLVGCSSFESLARRVVARAPQPFTIGSSLAVVSNAGRGELFFSLYRVEESGVRCDVEPRLVSVAQIEDGCLSIPDGTRWYTPERSLTARVRLVDRGGAERAVECVQDVASGMPLTEANGVPQKDALAALVAAVEPTYIREVAAKSLLERGIVSPQTPEKCAGS